MIVRYIGPEPHAWLRAGEDYVVLAVSASPRERDPLTLMIHHPDDGGAFDWGWWPNVIFEVISGAMPSSWVFANDRFGGFDLMPLAWLRPGHWDDLDPSDLDKRTPEVKQAATRRAWTDYRSERDQILAEAGRPPGHQGMPGPSCSWRPKANEEA